MIDVEHLRKEFFVPETIPGAFGAVRSLFSRKGHTVMAVNDISFHIEPGEFVGYIGPNGAGKSTTIKMLTGILHPTSGTVRVDGLSPQDERRKVVQRIGVVFGQRSQLWWDLPLRDSFDLLGAMYKVPAARQKELAKRFDDLLELGKFWDTPVRKLSLGQRMRGEICAALLHEPKILFLDEPTIGLDVVAKNAIREFLREINANGVTVLLTTHDLGDIEKLCRRVMVINNGSILFDGPIEAMHSRMGAQSQLVADFAAPVASQALSLPDRVTWSQPDPSRLLVDFDRAEFSPNEILHIISAAGDIVDIHIVEPDIEDAVTKFFRRQDDAEVV
jgi:ABC-2 type transport system ATP-binding protein